MDDHAARVLALVTDEDYVPLTVKGLARRFRIAEDEYPAFRNAIKALVRADRLELGKNKTISKASVAVSSLIKGTFRRSSKGFGFVRTPLALAKSDQIFIPVDAGRDASTGDEVEVRIVRKAKGPGFNPEGRVVRVVARSSGVFVGNYEERDGRGYVVIDGTAFHGAISVGDPGAKGARPGDKVALEIARYPTPYHPGEGVITEVFGPRGQPKVETLAIIRALGIPDVFDDDTLLDAREQTKLFKEEDVEGRLDLRDKLTLTIDPATARDFDDAITLERDDKGYWTLGVHIADVSHFVRPGSALDRTARKRGTSVYLPDRVIPMLPEVISNSLASLQAGVGRYTVSAFMEFDPGGIRTAKSFARSVIRVDHRFSYEQVMEALDKPEVAARLTPEIAAMLRAMHELAMILRKRRFARGALELNMPEVEVDLGEQGEVIGAHLTSHDESHQIIEEFMLAANEATATHLGEAKAGFLRRVHADPELRKLKEFAEFARSLGIPLDDGFSRFELQRVLAESADKPEAYAVHFGLLRSLKQAVYSPEAEGHYALASDAYCHFTSPIRRYPDLQVHRQLTALLAGLRPRSDAEELAALAEHCNKTERRGELAERELIKIKLLTFLETKIGEVYHAVIVGVEDFGFFCRLVEIPAEGFVHITSLADDYYYLEGATHTLVGRRGGKKHRLGDRIEVRIVRVDINRRELDLALADAPVALASATSPEPRLVPQPHPPRRGARPAIKAARVGKATKKPTKGKRRKRP